MAVSSVIGHFPAPLQSEPGKGISLGPVDTSRCLGKVLSLDLL